MENDQSILAALRNLKVVEYTSPDPITVVAQDTAQSVSNLMHQHGFRHVLVMDENRVTGVISDRDIMKALDAGKSIASISAADIMTAHPYSVTTDTSLSEVCFHLSSEKFNSAVVNNPDGSLRGIFTSTDALNALVEVLRGELPENTSLDTTH